MDEASFLTWEKEQATKTDAASKLEAELQQKKNELQRLRAADEEDDTLFFDTVFGARMDRVQKEVEELERRVQALSDGGFAQEQKEETGEEHAVEELSKEADQNIEEMRVLAMSKAKAAKKAREKKKHFLRVARDAKNKAQAANDEAQAADDKEAEALKAVQELENALKELKDTGGKEAMSKVQGALEATKTSKYMRQSF